MTDSLPSTPPSPAPAGASPPPNAVPPRTASTASPEDAAVVVASLERVRSRSRRLLILMAVLGILGVVVAFGTALGLIDYAIRLPSGIRLAILALGAWGVWKLIRRHVFPAWRFSPSLTELALRLERTPAGRAAGLDGLLASGLELSGDRSSNWRVDRDRAARAVRGALEKFGTTDAAAAVIRLAPVRRIAGIAAACLAPLLVCALLSPAMTSIGVLRILAPWSGAAWPKRAVLADATALAATSANGSIPLRAIVSHRAGSDDVPDVWVRYRTVSENGTTPWRRELLTPQRRRESTADGQLHGDLVERIVEPMTVVMQTSTEENAAAASRANESEFQYSFESVDDQTPVTTVRLIEPPAIVAASMRIDPPAYAAALVNSVPDDATTSQKSPGASTIPSIVAGKRPLPAGSSLESVGPVLAGSRVILTAELNKPVAIDADDTAAIFEGAPPAGAAVRAEAKTWTIEFTAEQSTRVLLAPRDEFGIGAERESVFAFSVVSDQPPTAVVLSPAQDEGVLPNATVSIEGEGIDDVALAWTSLQYRTARPPQGSEGAAAEVFGPDVELASSSSTDDRSPRLRAAVSSDLDLSTLDLKPGDEIHLTTLAKDIFDRGGVEHEAVRSKPRKLFIIPESALVEQIQRELAAVRQSAMRLDQDQQNLADRAAERTTAQSESAQRSLTQRLEPPGELIERLARRVERNKMDDQALRSLLQDAADAVREAADSSQRAAEALRDAQRESRGDPESQTTEGRSGDRADAGDPKDSQDSGEQPKSDEPTPRERELLDQARREQDAVRDQLSQLISMLDRGQDGWTVRREIQRLLEQQKQLTQDTSRATQSTTGKQQDDLTAQERERLAQLAQQQQDLSERTAAAIDELEKRAQSLEKTDPAQSAAMTQAASQARQNQAAAKQRQASQSIRENRARSANELQQEAAQALEEVLKQFDRASQRQDEALRRLLAQLGDQIQALIRQQNEQLSALADAKGNLSGLDAGMIRLNAATLALADSVREGPPGARSIAEPLDGSAQAQSKAIAAIRRAPPDAAKADEQERVSLARLNEALELSKKLDEQAQQRDQARERGELLEAYKAALEEQVVLNDETAPLVAKPEDRRSRAAARALGERQEGLRVRLAELRTQKLDSEDTLIFSFTHERIESSLSRVVASLREGRTPVQVGRDQTAATGLLRTLVQALSEGEQQDPFRDAPEGGGEDEGQGGQGGPAAKPRLIPDLAELKGLRGLQELAAQMTRAASESDLPITPDSLADLQSFQRDVALRGKALLDKLRQQEPPSEVPPPEGQPPPEGGDDAPPEGADQTKESGASNP